MDGKVVTVWEITACARADNEVSRFKNVQYFVVFEVPVLSVVSIEPDLNLFMKS